MAITQANLRDYLKAILALNGGVDVHYDPILVAALEFASNEIYAALAFRGYSPAQILAWDRFNEFHRDLAVWKTLQDAILLAPKVEPARVDRFDRRKELYGCDEECIDAVGVTTGGAAVMPATSVGGCSSAPLSTATDPFIPVDPEDGRLGIPTVL